MTLPPLGAVRVFEAVARHLNFTRAADELGMTQAAVSYQIKLLEERLGAALFLRRPRQVQLSETGAYLAPRIREAFDRMREAFADQGKQADTLLSVTTVPTFASQWLAQNLGIFQLAHPEIAVRLDSSSAVVDLSAGEFDIAVRMMEPSATRGLVTHLLLKADFTPLLSPALVESVGGIETPADLLKLPLLDPEDPWYGQWFAAAGVPNYSSAERPVSRLNWQSLLGSAAMAGRGVAMLTPTLFRDDIAAGRLIQPFPLLASAGRNYYLVYPESRRNAPKVRLFRDWMLEATAFMRPEEADQAIE